MEVLEEKNEQLMRDYWLGSLDSVQMVEDLEMQWFSNDDETELLQAIRADLIQDYLNNDLNQTELNLFVKNFLNNNIEDIAIAKSFSDVAKSKPVNLGKVNFFDGIFSWFGLPQFAAVLVLLGITGGFYLIFRNKESVQIVQHQTNENVNLITQKPIETNKIETENSNIPKSTKDVNVKSEIEKHKNTSNANKVSEPEIKPKQTEITKPLEKTEKKPIPIVLMLGGLRGGVKTLELSDKSKEFSLIIDMPGIDSFYKNYQVRIYDSANNVIVQKTISENLSTKKSGQQIRVNSISASKFKKNMTYKTVLVGIDEQGISKELSSYNNFEIKK